MRAFIHGVPSEIFMALFSHGAFMAFRSDVFLSGSTRRVFMEEMFALPSRRGEPTPFMMLSYAYAHTFSCGAFLMKVYDTRYTIMVSGWVLALPS